MQTERPRPKGGQITLLLAPLYRQGQVVLAPRPVMGQIVIQLPVVMDHTLFSGGWEIAQLHDDISRSESAVRCRRGGRDRANGPVVFRSVVDGKAGCRLKSLLHESE